MRLLVFVAIIATYSSAAFAQAMGPTVATSSAKLPPPAIITSPAQNGAQVVRLNPAMPGAVVRYTTDGSAPTPHSPQYLAPFLVASNLTVKAIAVANNQSSSVSSQTFTPNIPPKTLVWSDEFDDHTNTQPNHFVVAAPDANLWGYVTGRNGFGNHELETYCAWMSAIGPCDRKAPNAYVSNDGYLHIVARNPSPGVYTSARITTEGRFSVSYGAGGIRIEARMKLPEGQGTWPAFWTLGNTIATVAWPACGEQDIMEHIDAPRPDWIAGSLHGTHGDTTRHYIDLPAHPFSAADWHTYGILWSRAKISFYVDSPSNIYETNTPADFNKPGAIWPFDSGNGVYLLLNLAIGGDWPKAPDATMKFPAEMLVDYVRIYTN